jgi:phage replication O-like protein O
MASPQCENGFVMVAVELWDALTATRLPGEDMQVLMAIIRKTYGFKKKQDSIAISQLQKMTGLPRQSVCRSLKRLKERNLISSHQNATRTPSTYAPNKDWEKWVPSHKLVTTSHQIATSPSHQIVSNLVTKSRPSKETIQKKERKDTLVGQHPTSNGSIPYREIIEHLNIQTGKAFLPTSKSTRRHIKARWSDGWRLDDFKKVIDTKTEKWASDERMCDYLRPDTLFSSKFESYLNEGIVSPKLSEYFGE